MPIQRVMIFGGSGSGKSTLARHLAGLSGLPVIHMDHIYWQPGWVQRPPAEVLEMALEAARQPFWIIEGNHSASMDDRAAKADLLIWLDLPTPIRVTRVLWRILRNHGRRRPDMAAGCPEQFDWPFLRDWVIPYGRKTPISGRSRAAAFIARWRDRRPCLTLTTPAAVRAFLTTVKTRGLASALPAP